MRLRSGCLVRPLNPEGHELYALDAINHLLCMSGTLVTLIADIAMISIPL